MEEGSLHVLQFPPKVQHSGQVNVQVLPHPHPFTARTGWCSFSDVLAGVPSFWVFMLAPRQLFTSKVNGGSTNRLER